MEWQRGEWHTVVVERDPDYSDDLEFEEIHPPDCPTEMIYDGMVLAYRCSFGWEVENNGFGGLDIAEPGTYRVRVSTTPGSLWEEPDIEVEVEEVS